MNGVIELMIFEDNSGMCFLSEGYTTTVIHLESFRKQYPEQSELLETLVAKRDTKGAEKLLGNMGLINAGHKYR